MTKKEIIEKVLDKAEKNGYIYSWMTDPDKASMFSAWKGYFSHDFAKAFWGEEEANVFGLNPKLKIWQVRLAEMVLEEDPIKYLEKFL